MAVRTSSYTLDGPINKYAVPSYVLRRSLFSSTRRPQSSGEALGVVPRRKVPGRRLRRRENERQCVSTSSYRTSRQWVREGFAIRRAMMSLIVWPTFGLLRSIFFQRADVSPTERCANSSSMTTAYSTFVRIRLPCRNL